MLSFPLVQYSVIWYRVKPFTRESQVLMTLRKKPFNALPNNKPFKLFKLKAFGNRKNKCG